MDLCTFQKPGAESFFLRVFSFLLQRRRSKNDHGSGGRQRILVLLLDELPSRRVSTEVEKLSTASKSFPSRNFTVLHAAGPKMLVGKEDLQPPWT